MQVSINKSALNSYKATISEMLQPNEQVKVGM